MRICDRGTLTPDSVQRMQVPDSTEKWMMSLFRRVLFSGRKPLGKEKGSSVITQRFHMRSSIELKATFELNYEVWHMLFILN